MSKQHIKLSLDTQQLQLCNLHISPSYVPKKMYRGIKDENSMIGAAIEANLLLEKIDATKKQKLISATPNVMKKNHIKEGSVCLNTFESTIVQLIAMNRKITK